MSGSEFQLIEWLRARVGRDPRVPVGIGDDAAVIAPSAGAAGLVAVDMLMEGVHFTLPPATPRDVGRKALAVNLSDIAAMAGVPTLAVVAVALPRARGYEFAQELHRGLHELAREFDVALAGGDTNVWDGGLVVAVTVFGEATARGPVLRGGARPGDWILVTGALGGSLAGKHLSFVPRVREALRLHEAAGLNAMIDLSDGLATDLHRVLDESKVGAVLRAEAIPVSDAARAAADGRTPLEHALEDGEDFELLFTLAEEDARRLLASPPIELPLAHIGEITTGSGCELIDTDGKRRALPRAGWEHAF
ncbi:MAG: thiamine-phosphate kinase [Planctomycetales bacterium]